MQYSKTCEPQPARKVKKREADPGMGWMAYPEFMPRDTPMITIRMPVTMACVPNSVVLSVMAKRHKLKHPSHHHLGETPWQHLGPQPSPRASAAPLLPHPWQSHDSVLSHPGFLSAPPQGLPAGPFLRAWRRTTCAWTTDSHPGSPSKVSCGQEGRWQKC